MESSFVVVVVVVVVVGGGGVRSSTIVQEKNQNYCSMLITSRLIVWSELVWLESSSCSDAHSMPPPRYVPRKPAIKRHAGAV